jgi:cupin fold WbuC family metalloprotein
MTALTAALVMPEQLRDTGNGIFYVDRDFAVFDTAVIRFLKDVAASIDRRRARVCAHLSPDADQHDMLIVSHRSTYVAPHRHLSKSETMLVIEGSAEVIVFAENGAVTDRIPLGPPNSGHPFFYRMPQKRYHSLWIETEFLVFVECTKGPFLSEETQCAPWAPPPSDSAHGLAYLRALCTA